MSDDKIPSKQRRPPPPQPFEVTVARKLDSLSNSLLETFLRLDVDRDGYVTRSDLKTALHNVCGIDLTESQMDSLFVRFAYFEDDAKVQHGIRYQEFVRYIDATAKQRLSLTQPLEGTSTLLDANQNKRALETMMPILLDPDMERSRKRQALLRLLQSHESNMTALFLEMDVHRSGRITPDEFCDWVNSKIGKDNLLTVQLLKELLGTEHYKPDGMTQSDFVKAMADLERDTQKLGLEEMPFEDNSVTHDDDDSFAAREHYQEALIECVDNGKTDLELVREVANQLFVKRVKLVDAFRKYDVDGTGKLSAQELCLVLEEAAGLHVSVDRAQSLVDKFDIDGDGRLNKGEFVRLIASSSTASDTEEETQPPVQQQQQQAGEDTNDGVDTLRRSLVATIVGHEEQGQHVEICNRLDEDDIALLLSFRQALNDEHIMASKIFASMDTDRSRSITAEQLKAGFAKMGVDISQDHVDHLMTRFGTEETGKMKYHQFVKLLSANL